MAAVVGRHQARDHWSSRRGRAGELGEGDRIAIRRLSDQQLERSLHFFADTGVWTLDGDTFELTDLGREFATVLFGYLEERNG